MSARLCVLLLGAVFAVPAAAWQAQDDLKSFAAQVQSASGTFVQKTIGSDGSVADESSGEFAFLRPGYFKWNVEKPYVQKITGGNGILTIYDPDLMQVTRQSSGAFFGATPASVLFGGDAAALDAWSMSRCDSHDDACIRLSPKQESSFEWVEAVFSSSHVIESMRVKDSFGQLIEVQFKSIKQEKLTESDFEVHAPEGVDLVENLS